ncbi:helix-turn-helix domain-containing protein [Streptomyces palmae]
MRLVGLLRTEGPCTATQASKLTGESVASCSYHLRILAKYGLVEEAPSGQGREKPWRATARFTQWPSFSEDPVLAEASRELEGAVVERYAELMSRAVAERRTLPGEWQRGTFIGDQILYLTAAELAELEERLTALFRPYEDRDGDPAARPEGARQVQFIRAAFPLGGAAPVPDSAAPHPEAAPAGTEDNAAHQPLNHRAPSCGERPPADPAGGG